MARISQWVGHEEVARGDILPGWKRFKYFCNGHLQYVYCRTHEAFIALFEAWSRWSQQNGYVGRYVYTLDGSKGEDISLEDMIMDRPEGTEFRVKMYLVTHEGEYIQ